MPSGNLVNGCNLEHGASKSGFNRFLNYNMIVRQLLTIFFNKSFHLKKAILLSKIK